MTVESEYTIQTSTSSYDRHSLYLFAVFVSGSSSWEIIDSWESVTHNGGDNVITGRYKGDPIADTQWTVWSDLGNGGGIVIQQKNPRAGYPPMQVVMQASEASTLGIVSGSGYSWNGTSNARGNFVRVGTQGDWNADAVPPDFDAPTKASDVRQQNFNNFGGGGFVSRMAFSMDDDWVVWVESNDKADAKDFITMWWFGQYNPKTPGQESVASPAYALVSTNGSGLMLSPDADGWTGQFLKHYTTTATELIGCLDENGVWKDWSYSANPGLSDFLGAHTQPNEFDADVGDAQLGIDLYEVVIRGTDEVGPGPDDRLIGSLRGVYAGNRLGNGAFIDGGVFFCLGIGYGVIIEWDGTTEMV
jgi:hypothetical protein